MTTLIPTSSSSQPPAATAAAAAAGVEAYEDMFKEITRKLYGDESAHGLYPHNTQVAQVAQLAPGAPSAAPEGGERSFTTLVSDRNITTIDYETTTVNDQQQQGQQGQGQRSEEHLTTAFGLAALMQNGFPPPGAILNPVNFPAKANLVTSDDRWQQNQQQQQDQPAEQSWSGKHSSTSYSHKSFKKPKVEPQDGSPTGSSTLNIPQSDKGKGSNFNASSTASVGAATGKRYACTSCPYTTDRRDLFTRHENIHKEEKPFHCYACLKQFNRADHVKKHFMRMHRDMDYEIAKTRRITAASSTSSTPTNAKPYYSSSSSNTPVSAPAPPPPTTVVSPPVTVIPVVSTLNIPTANFPTSQLSIPTSHHHANATTTIESSSSSTHNSTVTAVVNSHNIITLNGGVLHHHQQQQNQQNQHQPVQQQQQQIVVAPQIVTIKQEKGVLPRDVVAGNSSSGGSTVTAAALVDEKPFAKKVKGEKRFTCCYCPWSGADNWGLKRHLNTHTKPYVCMLCDYKAARSERLATHVFKVHNKKACSKCTFFAEDQDQLNAHMQDSHLLTMQALGRNKASVTQDFHNAGGATTHHRLYHHSNSLNDSSSDSNASNGSKDDASHSPSSSASAPSRSPSTSPPAVAAAIAPMAGTTLSEEHLSLLQLLATAAVAQQHLQLQQQQKLAPSSASAILSSPPANLNLNSTNQQQVQQVQQVQDAKRRRKSSSRNDKENLGQKQQRTVAVGGKVIDLTVTAPGQAPAGDGIERNNNSSSNNNNSSVNNKNINEAIFDRVMYKKPSSYQNMFLTSAAFCKPVLGAVEKDQQQVLRKEDRVIVAEKSFSLAEFLRNHTEVSITTTAKATSADNDDDVVFIKEEKRRKQQAPRKVDQRTVGDIRDKHMIRLITRRLCCRICQNQQRNGSLDNCHYHSKTSLILHNRWRHRGQAAAVGCRKCGQSFPRKYKLALHQKLVHRANGGKPKKVTAAAKKQQRKQRKRKPKSRCFTKRRK